MVSNFGKVVGLGLVLLCLSWFLGYFLNLQEGLQNRASSYSNDACRGLDTQQACLKYKYCGWCPDQGRCIEWDTSSGTPRPRDRIYRDVQGKCDVKQFQFAPETASDAKAPVKDLQRTSYSDDVCRVLATKDACMKYKYCGWCPDQERCVEWDTSFRGEARPRDYLYSDVPARCKKEQFIFAPGTASSIRPPVEGQGVESRTIVDLRSQVDMETNRLKSLNSLIAYNTNMVASLKQRESSTRLKPLGRQVVSDEIKSINEMIQTNTKQRDESKERLKVLQEQLKTMLAKK